MATTSETTADLAAVEDALAGGRPVDDVLDLADEVIEHASAAGDAAALACLAGLLGSAGAARPDGRGLALAALRARAVAAAAPPVEAPPIEAPTAAEIHEPVVEGPPAEAVVRYAGWWRRVFAHLVDWFALLVVLGFLPIDPGEVLLGAFFVLPIAYFAGMHAYVRGQTIGKALFGIAVRREGGRPVDLATAIPRALAQSVLWITVIGGIVDALAPLADGRKRALHDRAAGTVVVAVR